jgi:ABC-type phosphate transport system substrate-binding protein
MNPRTRVPCYLAGLVAGSLGILAQAQQAAAADCSTLPSPVYVTGSSAVQPFLARAAAILAAQAPPVTIVYLSQGSCNGVNPMVATPTGTITGTGVIWDTTGTAVTGGCALDLTGNTVDIGVSDVFATSCPSVVALPTGIKDFYGPIQSMTFAVPLASTKQSISAEAAYLLMGFGADGGTPWTDINQVMVRSASSGTQQMLSAAINVPATKWLGKSNSGSGDVLNGLVAATAPDLAIGILSSDYVDKNRSKVRSLAYQHYGQSCGYTPDSDPVTAFDKKNVRDGHYAVWGPLHLLTKVDAAGAIVSPNVKKVVDNLSLAPSVSDAAAVTLIATEAKGGVVPDCAMRVKRDGEVGPMMSYMPPRSCECRFVFEATGATTCTTCTSNASCPASAPACNYGYCEVQ